MTQSVIHNDCLTVLDNMIANNIQVDCIVTDPPYRIVAGGVRVLNIGDECTGVLSKRDYSKTDPKGCLARGKKVVVSDGTKCSNKWLTSTPSAVKDGKMFDYNSITFEEWMPKLYAVLKEQSHCYIMINSRNLNSLWNEALKAGFRFQNLLAWVKNNATPNKYYMQQMEFILMLRKGKAKNINNMGTKNALHYNNIVGNKLHPTQKPVELLQTLIANSTNEGDTVLDPFMGAGSTAIACKNLNREFIGVEIDKRYIDITKQRLNNYATNL